MKKKLHLSAVKDTASPIPFILWNTGSARAEYIANSTDPFHEYILWVKSKRAENKEQHIADICKFALNARKLGYKLKFTTY